MRGLAVTLEAGMKISKFVGRVLPLFLAVFLFGIQSPAWAQSDTSSLSGTISDSSGAVVPKVKVTVHNVATGQDNLTMSNENGNFTLTNLQPGKYTLRVESPG